MIDLNKIREDNLNRIEKLGYKRNHNLPLLELKNHRNSNDVLNRIIILHILYAIYLEGFKSIEFFYKEIIKNNLQDYLTNNEKCYFAAKKVSKLDLINFSWYKESIFVLLWSMKQINDDSLAFKVDEIDISDYYHLMPPEKDYYSFFELQIADEYNLYKLLYYYYLLHSCVKNNNNVNNWISKLFMKDDRNIISIVSERRKALEWIVDSDLDWDDISLDT